MGILNQIQFAIFTTLAIGIVLGFIIGFPCGYKSKRKQNANIAS
jgi:uncharacterized membrane protein (Fun14 family)